MKTSKPIKSPTSVKKIRAVRFYAVIYFSVLMTVLAPIYPAQSPVFRLNTAEAESVNVKSFTKEYMLLNYKWESEEFKCLGKLWGKESAWNHEAESPTQDYGIPQRHMSKNTENQIAEFLESPINQIIWGLNYIDHRYGSPCLAWQHHEKRNWY